jgi:hypothetical protein
MATYELIEHIEVGSGGAGSITFTSTSTIPTDYADLVLVYSGRTDRAATDELVYLSFNGETTGFSSRELDGNGSAAFSGTVARLAGAANGSTSTSNTFSNVSLYFPNYRSSNNKSYSADSVLENNATFGQQIIVAGLRTDTDPIDSITLTPANGNDFVQYSSATLYGIRKYNTASAPKATGGIITYDATNDYWVHTFTASGTFTPTEDLTAEYLVIAGGGAGGGSYRGAGGGAGGYRCSVTGEDSGGGASAETALTLSTSTSYTVTVGAGGSGVTGQNGGSGAASVFATITSNAGGGGGKYETAAPSGTFGSGGGGGGGNASRPAGETGTTNQGFAGGSGASDADSNDQVGGGGGGAGSAGVNAGGAGTGASGTSTTYGDGGQGVTSSITGSAIARAGGGSGGNYDSALGANVTVAVDGGGTGGSGEWYDGAAGTVNTGGGGGGSSGTNTTGAGGNGGSGVVIVRYAA